MSLVFPADASGGISIPSDQGGPGGGGGSWSAINWLDPSVTRVTTGAYDDAASTISGESVTIVTKNATHGAPDAGVNAGGLWIPITLANTAFGIAFEIEFGTWSGGFTTADIGLVLCLADTPNEVQDKGIYAGMTSRSSSGGSFRPVAGYLGYTQGNGSMVPMTPTEMHGSLLLADTKGVVASSTTFNSLGPKDPHAVHNRMTDPLGTSLYLGLLPIVVPSGASPVNMEITRIRWAPITAPA